MRHVNLTSKEKYSCQSHKLWEFRHSICRTKFAAESLSEITCSKEDGRVHVMCSALAELGFVLFTPFVILQLKKKKDLKILLFIFKDGLYMRFFSVVVCLSGGPCTVVLTAVTVV